MRYDRQIQMAEIGEQGQHKLQNARVLVVGAGGLGCQVLPLLVGAGVGFIRIYDADVVDETNLHRQTLYRMSDIGIKKVHAAIQTLQGLNPEVVMEGHATRLYVQNIEQALQDIDVVIDAADNFVTTYLLSDICFAYHIPFVSASVIMREGYVGAFCAGAPSYRAIFPRISQQLGSCNTQGVMGPAVAVVGAMQAQVALSLLLDFKPSVLGQFFQFDFTTWQHRTMKFHLAEEPVDIPVTFIDVQAMQADDYVVDLRSEQELKTAPAIQSNIRLSVDECKTFIWPNSTKRLVLVCRQGVRALSVGQYLNDAQGIENIAILAMGDG
ncbi:HesA/MoeB/ThiF family protein [Acinetobacter boissieri]|uniref:Molybdopterin or thiamine biosynthesis adenylyltransferase n=1 Tax=Acinetobacter boissieri TaxID=1219383 RepID=A0A1G6GJK1_9GAMM|nr:HesA/MoeB/ThiF family protein [Acinetobacter boissieri]SDB81366.1 Molybdopterin or thiamine biosynthesis adenylyltransferase [Acinetobacter boissieri]